MTNNTYRAAAIGRTGGGDYGHNLHLSFRELGNVELVAIADPDEAGRKRAQAESGACNGYADYAEMLGRERPDIVNVCPRWTDCHLEMVLACIEAGAHVYCEKPLTWSLEEGDRIVAAAAATGKKVAVAHQSVHLPILKGLMRMIQEGRIGEPLSIHTYGKQDARGGGEDMIVLGTHLFNLMRYLAGDVLWMFGHVTIGGKEITLDDISEPSEPVGLVAGDRINSYYAFAGGLSGFFESRRFPDKEMNRYGLFIEGSEGTIAASTGGVSDPMIYPHPLFKPWVGDQRWQPLRALPIVSLHETGNRFAVLDLIASIEEDRDPLSSASDAVAALEMILGTYESQITKSRVQFPMRQRRHPLAYWREGFYD